LRFSTKILNMITPTEPAALIGMLIYTSFFLVFAYIIYQRRQSKSE